MTAFLTMWDVDVRLDSRMALDGADVQVETGELVVVVGLSGVGDTFGTCFGPLSRNRQVGYRLGKGERLDEIIESMSQVAEGVATARALPPPPARLCVAARCRRR